MCIVFMKRENMTMDDLFSQSIVRIANTQVYSITLAV